MIHVNLRRNVAGILTDFVGFGTSLGFIGFDTLLPLLTFALTGNEALVGLVGLPHHFPTPTWTFRKRAPDTPWPTCAPWLGSPLPQFGVPSIT